MSPKLLALFAKLILLALLVNPSPSSVQPVLGTSQVGTSPDPVTSSPQPSSPLPHPSQSPVVTITPTPVTPAPSSKPTINPDLIISSTPSPTAKPTPVPTTSPQPTSTPQPTPAPSPESPPTLKTASSDNQSLDLINNYRTSHGQSPASSDSKLCDFAQVRVNEITSNFSHQGFRDRLDNNSLPLPSYSLITENIAQNSSPAAAVDSWIYSSSHADNMLKDTPYICVASSGDYYVMLGWKP